MTSPLHRWLRIRAVTPRTLARIVDPVEHAMAKLTLRRNSVPREIAAAYDMGADPGYRTLMDAFLLAGATDSDLKTSLGVDAATAYVYSRYCFDVSVFMHHMARTRYVVQELQPQDPVAARCALAGLEHGLDFLKAQYGGGQGIDIEAAQARLMATAYKRALTQVDPKEARQWTATFASLSRSTRGQQPSLGAATNATVVATLTLSQPVPHEAEGSERAMCDNTPEDLDEITTG